MEGSPRPSAQKSRASETAAISSQKPDHPTEQAQTSKGNSDASTLKPVGKSKKKRQVAQNPGTDTAPKPQLEEGDEGMSAVDYIVVV